jgi:Holliday junction resolvasome RuvABC endonuclease subunit
VSLTTVGLDLSLTGTGIVVVRDGTVIYQNLLHTEPADGSQHSRISYIVYEVAAVVRRVDPDLVGMEGYAFDKKFGGETLAEIHGVVKHYLFHEEAPWALTPPQSLKKYALGGVPQKPKGWTRSNDAWRKEVKKMMIASAVALGCETGDDNVADAFHVARWASREFRNLISGAMDRLG